MKKIFVFVGLIYVFFINSGCPKPCIEANYSFAVNSQIKPDVDSVHIGDTIFLISSFSNKLTDQSTGKIVDYSNATDIGSALSVFKLIKGDTIATDAVFDFSYISVNGRVDNNRSIPRPDGIQQLTYQEVNEKYILKIGLIPKQKGVYGLGLHNGLSNGRKNSSSCEKAGFDISYNNTNQHFYLLTEWKPDNVINDFGKAHGYYFKVY